MAKIPPFVGVLLLVLCLFAQLVSSRYHLDAGEYVSTIFGVGLAIVYGQQHAVTKEELVVTKNELTTLRASMRPAREPSMHDIDVIPPSGEAPKP